jgi:hydroxyethylthiazole kinase-like uncharacterized protein yjeF
MRAIEMAAIESGAVTGLELMERAGQGVVDAVFEEWPELGDGDHRAVVLCGPGNNGGDGFVIARLLKELGWEVEVFLYGDAEKLPPDARVNYELWGALGEVRPYVDDGEGAFWLEPAEYRENTILVDALFGTGLTRPVEGFNAFGWVTQLTEWRLSSMSRLAAYPVPRIVAVDIPSGVCADSGKWLTNKKPPRDIEEIKADLTVSFHSQKVGHVLADGPGFCSKVVVVDIGLSSPRRKGSLSFQAMESIYGRDGARHAICRSVTPPISAYMWKEGDEHKYTHGHSLILSGGSGKTGAARLAARGALRIGAGLVTLGVPPSAQMEVAGQITALMLKRVEDADALAEILQDKRFNALCLGPGLGLGRARALVPAALAAPASESGPPGAGERSRIRSGTAFRSVVLDADALTAFQGAPETLFVMLHENCVLTPHEGEFKRLFPDLHAKLAETPTKGPAYSKVDATREAAARAGCTILFKGPDTVIADQTGACSINSAHYDRAAPWLATAGSGDVLAGFIAGLLARGFAPKQAAEIAAWLHVECAQHFGPGLIAEDLPEQIPAVFRSLGL